jgi:hypothetical protein
MSTLTLLASIGQGAEIAGDDELARAIETTVYLMCNRRHGEDFWEEHAVECLGANADAVECWQNLLEKLGTMEGKQ